MHIHGANSQMFALIPTQSAQQAEAARKAAAEVRRKLSGFAASAEGERDAISQVQANAERHRGQKQKQAQDDPDQPFRGVFLSITT